MIFLKHWKLFKPIRACIEHFFKLMKEKLGYNIYHVYTEESMKKTAFLNVLLTALTNKRSHIRYNDNTTALRDVKMETPYV